MSQSDPIGDMLTRIRNGQSRNKVSVLCPASNVRASICGVLKDEGYIRGYKVVDAGNNKQEIEIELKYDEGQPAIRELKRVSKPGRRVYSKINDLQPHKNGLGINIVSTSRGVMPDYKARNENVGGEVLCQVY